MSATTAVAQGRGARLGVMVRTADQIMIYWEMASATPLRLRVSDLTGRPPADSLDGRGWRELHAEGGRLFLEGLLPGHLYGVALGEGEGDRFRPLLQAGPVQTPWRRSRDSERFPAPYHRS